MTLKMKAPGSTSTPKRCPSVDKAPRLSISIVNWILSSDTDTDTICQLNQFHTNSEAAMLSSPLPPDIFCKDQNLHQVVHLTYTIWGANEPNGREYENCIETRLKSFSNGTQKYPKQIQKSTQNKLQKHPVYICTIKLPQIYFFHFGKGMRVGTTPPARRVGEDFSASFQKSPFFI